MADLGSFKVISATHTIDSCFVYIPSSTYRDRFQRMMEKFLLKFDDLTISHLFVVAHWDTERTAREMARRLFDRLSFKNVRVATVKFSD